MASVSTEKTEARHKRLERLAEESGLSVQELLVRETEASRRRVSQAELLRRLKTRSRVAIGMSGADLVHAAREEQALESSFDRH